MKTIWCDFNAMIDEDNVSLETRGAKLSLVTKDGQPDERCWFTDKEFWVQGTICWDGRFYWARLDWNTMTMKEPEPEDPD